MRCDTCLHARSVISENGMHYVCCLSDKEVLYCLTGQEDSYVKNPMKKGVPNDEQGT